MRAVAIECEGIESTSVLHKDGESDELESAEGAGGRPSADGSERQGARRRRRRRHRKDGGSLPATVLAEPSEEQAPRVSPAMRPIEAPTGQSSSSSSDLSHSWVMQLMHEALDHAQDGAYEAALEALARLLLRDGERQLTRAQLYHYEHQRVRGGWQVTVTLASDRVFAGQVKTGKQAAWESAM